MRQFSTILLMLGLLASWSLADTDAEPTPAGSRNGSFREEIRGIQEEYQTRRKELRDSWDSLTPQQRADGRRKLLEDKKRQMRELEERWEKRESEEQLRWEDRRENRDERFRQLHQDKKKEKQRVKSNTKNSKDD